MTNLFPVSPLSLLTPCQECEHHAWDAFDQTGAIVEIRPATNSQGTPLCDYHQQEHN